MLQLKQIISSPNVKKKKTGKDRIPNRVVILVFIQLPFKSKSSQKGKYNLCLNECLITKVKNIMSVNQSLQY